MDFDSKDKENNEASSSISSDLIRGHINTIILRTLYDGDKYGYEIINEIEEKSKGQYTLKQPTLYSALKRLETQDFVTSYWGGVSNGGRRKYFQLTEKGKIVAEHNLAEWEYSRTVIDNLISEREFDFNKPAPSAVDFNILKKSTTRVRNTKPDMPEEEESADLDRDFSKGNEIQSTEVSQTKVVERETPDNALSEQNFETPQYTVANESRKLNDSDINEYLRNKDSEQNDEPENTEVLSPLSEEEKLRIHENYKKLVGEDTDATAYYYSHVNQQQRSDEKTQNHVSQESEPYQQAADESYYSVDPNQIAPEHDRTYMENNAIASELLYSNKSPAERNYKQLLAKLYDNTQKYPDESEYDESYFEERIEESRPHSYEQTAYQDAQQGYYQQTIPQQEPVSETKSTNFSTASNIEFYDVQEKAESDGLKVNTANTSRVKAQVKSVGNTYDKGKVMFVTALYVFIIALIESIVSLCLKGVLKTSTAYVVLPFVACFVMFGVFMFLYLKGYGKNSRKSQAKSFISATMILFANLVLIICLIAYLIIFYNEITPTFTEICKYAIFPCIFAFNVPLFAIFYNYNRNKE